MIDLSLNDCFKLPNGMIGWPSIWLSFTNSLKWNKLFSWIAIECKVKPIEKKKAFLRTSFLVESQLRVEWNQLRGKKHYFCLNSPVVWEGDRAVAGPSLIVHLLLASHKLCLCLCLCLTVHLLLTADKLPTTTFFASLLCQHIPHLFPIF